MKERQPISFTIIHDLPNVRGLSFDDALNGLWLCVCLPLAQCFKLQKMLMGQIAQNRCYTLAR